MIDNKKSAEKKYNLLDDTRRSSRVLRFSSPIVFHRINDRYSNETRFDVVEAISYL